MSHSMNHAECYSFCGESSYYVLETNSYGFVSKNMRILAGFYM